MNGVVVANITRVEEKNMNNNTVYTVSQSLQRAAYTNTGPNATQKRRAEHSREAEEGGGRETDSDDQAASFCDQYLYRAM